MTLSVRSDVLLTPALNQFLATVDNNTFSMTMEFPRQPLVCDATMEYLHFGSIDISRYRGHGLQKCHRRREHILADHADEYYLCIPQESEYGIRYGGIESKASPNSLVFLPTANPFQAYICETSSRHSFTALFIKVPGPLLRRRVPRIDDLCGCFIPITPGIGHAMQSSVLTALENGPFLNEAEIEILNAGMMDMICHVATVKLGIADGNTIFTSGKSKLLTRAKAFIEAQLSNPDLGPKSVARHCGVSTRYLNAVFSLSSDSVASFIKEQRLQRCYEALQNRELLHRSIIDIAADWGFNNSSHFSQIYKARFGNPPSRDRMARKLRLV